VIMDRTGWNEKHAQLRLLIRSSADPTAAMALFLKLHAAVHPKRAEERGEWSLAEEAVQGLEDKDLRRVPPGEEHSLTWIMWHLARIEDVTMNVLVAGGAQEYVAASIWRRCASTGPK
jgi:hypothetical protein